MNDSDKRDFSAVLKAVLEVYGVTLSAAAVGIWWAALRGFDLVIIRAALSAYVQSPEGHFAPKPADVITWIHANDGHVGPEEAWAIVSTTLASEGVTVFWTQPMQAAFGVALALSDDRVAARKSFLEVYERELKAARSRGEGPQWQMSPGTDPYARDAAIAEAVRLGRLGEHQAVKLLSNANAKPQWLEQKFPTLKALSVA